VIDRFLTDYEINQLLDWYERLAELGPHVDEEDDLLAQKLDSMVNRRQQLLKEMMLEFPTPDLMLDYMRAKGWGA